MGKIKIKAGKSAVDQAQSSGEFEEAPPGLYVGKLKTAKPGFAKDGNGGQDKSRPYVECIYSIEGVGRENAPLPDGKRYGQVWDYVSFGAASEWKVAQFGLAMGLPIKNGAIEGDLENEEGKPGTIIGKTVLIGIRGDKDQQGNYRAKVRNVYPMGEASAEADSSLFEDGDGDEPTDDLDAADGFDDETTADEGGEYLTAEELGAMDLKELGGIATDFDLEPKSFIVKTRGKLDNGKTVEALVAAILEAQGAEDDATGEDDEDPF